MVNHYQNKEEGFLGWLVAQPLKHRMTFSEMSREELEEFGIVMERLEKALRDSYNAMYPTDPIEIVYLTRLGESTLVKPAEWHVHVHMLPRTASMRGKSEGWEIWKCRERRVKPPPSEAEIEQLMTKIRHSFGEHF
jgi:diadenosine tetraphosphate (Ap4A) HIT family hydrolase